MSEQSNNFEGSYEAWRISYQSSEQAARAAFKEVQRLEIDVRRFRGIIKTERDAVIKLQRLVDDIETLAKSRR